MTEPGADGSGTEGDQAAKLSLLRLVLVKEIGPIGIRRLLERFGSAEAVFSAGMHELQEVERIGPKAARAIREGPTEEDARAELEKVRAAGARIVTIDESGYPVMLKSIHDPPPVLYVKGELKESDALALAVVGTRRASFYALKEARSLAAALASMGFTIVSGLARGIDAAAHEGALQAGGRTIAVFGTGLGTVFPPENADLASRVAGAGALVSEFPVDYPVLSENFPRRNRIVSGLAMGVLVVEGSETSGAMITARLAMEQGREVFAVPGQIDNPKSRGPHRLIRDGARLVESVEDILDELGPLPVAVRTDRVATVQDAQVLRLNSREQRIYSLLDSVPKNIDELTRLSGVGVSEVTGTLTVLELRKLAGQLAGKRFVRVR